MSFKLHLNNNRVEPIAHADDFFSKPELLNQSIIASHVPTKCSAGCLALRIPDPPQYSLPAICAISKNGRIAAVGGRDVELFLWDTNTGELLTTIRGHDVCWTSSYANEFYITVQEDSKVITWDQELHTQRSVLGKPDEPIICCAVSTDDLYIVCGGARGGVYAWPSSGDEEHHFAGGHVGPVQQVMCYAMEDGSHHIISCGASDQTIVIWDLTSGERKMSVPISELEHAKNLKYHIRCGTHVLVWCTDAVPFPNLMSVDISNQTKSSVYSHEGLVRHAVYSKNGESLISCGNDSKIVVWDAATLEARMTLTGHTGSVLCCSINNEGTRIVSSGEDATIRVWSLEDGRQLQRMEAQDEAVKLCTFAKKGSKILTCDASGRAYVWSSLGEVVLNLVRRYADSISSICMSNDGKLLLSGCNNGRVMLWNADKRRNVWEFSHHTGRVEAVCFNSVRDLGASAGADGRLSLFNVEKGKTVNSFLGNDEPIIMIAFSPDDERIAGISADGKLLIYLTNSSARKPKLMLHSNMSQMINFAWSPNSKLVAGCGSDGCVLVWHAVSGTIFTVLEGNSAATCCAFDQIGKLVAVGSYMGSTSLYNLETGELLSVLQYNAGPLREVVFNQETSKLATICSRQAQIWDVATSKKIRTFDFVVDKSGDFQSMPLHPYRTAVAHSGTVLFDPESEALVYDMVAIDDPLIRSYYLQDTRLIGSGTQNYKRFAVWSATGNSTPDKFHTTHDAITSCHFSHDDRLIVMGTQDGNIVVYDVVHHETVEVIPAHTNGPCRCVRLSYDNSEILSCGADAKIILWDWRQRLATRIYSGHFISVGCCDLAFQGNFVVSGDNHGMISIFDKETGDSVQAIPLAHSKSVLSVSMSADGSTVASVGADDKVSIWSVEEGIELVSLTAAIESHPLHCSFSHDGTKLAVTESNGNVMIWNAMAGCQWYMIMGAHHGRVTSCSWSFDCRRFITAGTDSVLAVWDSESGAPLLKFNIGTGPLTTCAVSPMGVYVAAGSSTGTLSVCSIPLSSKAIPEPSFLYNWLSTRERPVAENLYGKLVHKFSTLANVQDAQGWSLVHHTMNRGNANVAKLILDSLPNGCGSLGLTSAVPYTIQTRVKMDEDDDYGEAMGEATELRGMLDPRCVVSKRAGEESHSRMSEELTAAAAAACVTSSQGKQLKRQQPPPQRLRIPPHQYPGTCSASISARLDADGSHHRLTVEEHRGVGTASSMQPYPQPVPSGMVHVRRKPPPLSIGSQGPVAESATTPSLLQGLQRPPPIHIVGSPLGEARMNTEQSTGLLGYMLRVASTTVLGSRNNQQGGRRARRGMASDSGSIGNVSANDFYDGEGRAGVQKSSKSFSQRVKKAAVELFTETQTVSEAEIIMNNSLALSLNSNSSECVRVLLDAAADDRISWGSYHCITDMMPSLAGRYPYMCFQFLSALELQQLGELEVPVNVMKDLDSAVIRTAPIFTNVKNLWQSHFKGHEVRSGPQAYAHVRASMVRLPFACAIGRESLLQTLVQSDVPVQTFNTPTVRAVVRHKWKLYGSQRLAFRTSMYVLYTFLITVWAVLYMYGQQDRVVLPLSEYWESGKRAKAQLIIGGYLFIQALWYAYVEIAHIVACGPRQYLRSVWNFVDLASISLMLIIIPMNVARSEMEVFHALAPMISVEVVLVYGKMLHYALVFEPTGPVVHIALEIAWKVRMWFALLLVTLCAFGTALLVLYDSINYDSDFQYGGFGQMLLTMYLMVFLEFDINDMLHDSSSWQVIAICIFCIFMAVVHLLLFNMLIALMWDEYKKVRSTEVDMFLRGRANIIVELEALMGKAQIEYYSLMPPYVHMLTSMQRKVDAQSSVESRLERMEAMLAELLMDGSLNARTTGAPGARKAMGGHLPYTSDGFAKPGELPPSPSRAAPTGILIGGVRAPPGLLLGDGSPTAPAMMTDENGLLMAEPHDQLAQIQHQLHAVVMRLEDVGTPGAESGGNIGPVLRQVERLQRTVDEHGGRMESVVTVLRDIESLLRNQQPFVVHTESGAQRGGPTLTEAELEKEVKRLLGRQSIQEKV